MNKSLLERLLDYYQLSYEDYLKITSSTSLASFSNGHQFDDIASAVKLVKDVMKDLWTQSEKLNEVLRNKYSDIKEAQDIARSSDGDSKEEAPKECPECWEPMNGDTCSECWYTFKS